MVPRRGRPYGRCVSKRQRAVPETVRAKKREPKRRSSPLWLDLLIAFVLAVIYILLSIYFSRGNGGGASGIYLI